VVNIGRRLVDGPFQELLRSLTPLAVSLLVATIFWRYVEEPAKRVSNRVVLRASFAAPVSQTLAS
jgi:peptidoglycan/LPS O-acetylase OafA/YrhL